MAASDNRRPSGGHTLFRYTAKDIDGRTVRGTMEAADYDALYAQLLEQGLYPQRVTGRGADRRPRTLRPQELSDLCRQLSTLLASGVSLVRALTIISQDEGISATTVKKRLGFQKMIADAVDGKIDLILTKSISRFGRNIVDILDNLNVLSALNPPVSVEFETEHITYTGDGKNNLLIVLLSALAEMESQQKSEAIKAGIRWRMAEGIYKFSVQNTLGFYRDHFVRLVIEPTEARIVEYIYESCLEGAMPSEIAAALTEQGIKSPMGNDSWSVGTIRSILRNEKYCGDALMQKTYTKDFRTHKSVKNTDLNMYFKENHHTAIIKKEDWLKVQKLLSERHTSPHKAKLRFLSNRFVAHRVKDGLFKGYLILDSRWSPAERQEFMKIVDDTQDNTK